MFKSKQGGYNKQAILSLLTIILQLYFISVSHAGEVESLDMRITRSLVNDTSELAISKPLVLSGARERKSQPIKQNNSQRATPLHLNDEFWIAETEVILENDDDDDGYFYSFSVRFDPDIHYGDVDVYAELYLSHENGPWNHYATTETFRIHPNDPFDSYTISTALEFGYPSGHYDILIELYDAYNDELVTELGPEESSTLSLIPLEDAERDFPEETHETGHVVHGGGASGGVGLFILSLFACYTHCRQVFFGKTRPQ